MDRRYFTAEHGVFRKTVRDFVERELVPQIEEWEVKGGIQRLSKRVGTAWAKQMNMTGEPIDAQTALRINLTNQVVPADKLMEETKKIAKSIMACAPLAVRMIKTLVNEGADIPIDKALALDAKAAGVLFSTQDQKEGMNAFVEKRKPQFKGR